ncbi:hypothetical protein [Mucisphaera calidilacus]|uniref:Dockerin domain-containing protein n=1 Tax=Mucisphaera calidilacus TaxID=2527982 RepID=A0A518C096_9BACT|nr:hypothetical protein [Mucisphaera calidilacus]QDU72644.1 hypothetical protein Pan265_25160 [Mucisphaera calidilacus]
MRKALQIAISLAFCASTTQADVSFSGAPVYQATVGAWWTPFYDLNSSEPAKNWADTRYDAYHSNPSGQTALGTYSSGWVQTIDSQIAQMKAAGIDFVLSDLTNGVGNGMSETEILIQRNTIPVAAAIGGPLWFGGPTPADVQAQMQLEVDAVWNKLANQPNYVQYEGQPLLVAYASYDQGTQNMLLPFWGDSRFNVQRATGRLDAANANLDLDQLPWDSWWGWLNEDQFASPTAMVVSPGYDTVHLRGSAGFKKDRFDGEVYIQQWLGAIANDPDFVIIASWNDYNEENHIEPSEPRVTGAPQWKDINGFQTSDLYVQLTQGYTALRANVLIEGFYYSEESSSDIYRLEQGSLIYIGAVSQIEPNSAVVRLPGSLLTDIRNHRTLSTYPPPTLPSGDLDSNGIISAADFDILLDAIHLGSIDPAYDYDFSGTIDALDARVWLVQIFNTRSGDINLDHLIDLNDLSLLATYFGQSGSYKQGDANFNGVIDLLDLSIMATNFGYNSVPEPAFAWLTATLVGHVYRRTRSTPLKSRK